MPNTKRRPRRKSKQTAKISQRTQHYGVAPLSNRWRTREKAGPVTVTPLADHPEYRDKQSD